MSIIHNKTIKCSVLCVLLISMSSQAVDLAGLRNIFVQAGKKIVHVPKLVVSKFVKTTFSQNLASPPMLGKVISQKQPIISLGLVATSSIACVLVFMGMVIMRKKIGSLIERYKQYRRLCEEIRKKTIEDRKLYCNIKKCIDSLDDVNISHWQLGPVKMDRSPLHSLVVPFAIVMLQDMQGRERKTKPIFNKEATIKLVKWLIEKKFANINKKYNGYTPEEIMGTTAAALTLESKSFIDGFIEIYKYLEIKSNQHNDLIDKVDTLKNDFDQQIIDNAFARFQEIKDLIKNDEIPGYAKMLVLPKLVELYKVYGANLCTEDDIRYLYKHIVFNKPFMTKQNFAPAIVFAKNKNIKDKNGHTLFEATVAYENDDTIQKYVANKLETEPAFYSSDSNRLLQDWLAKQPSPYWYKRTFLSFAEKGKSFFINLKKKIFGSTVSSVVPLVDDINYEAKKYYENALDLTKKNYKKALYRNRKAMYKKEFRDLANTGIVMNDLKRLKIPNLVGQNGNPIILPNELVSKIMGYAGVTNYGNKVYFK